MISVQEALQQLRDGNRRFVSDLPRRAQTNRQVRNRLVAGQEPAAVIIGCSDSRVPAEIVFDQGLGDLFVIRVAGNIVEPSQIGSTEFAVETFGTRLVVVLGHSHCGAVEATLNNLERPTESLSPNLRAIVDFIRPSVEKLLTTDAIQDREVLLQQAVRANLRASVNRLCEGSKTFQHLIRTDGLVVLGAEYSVDTGHVEFDEDIAGTVMRNYGDVTND